MPWPKGKHHSEEQKRKISKAMKPRKFSEEHRRKISEALKGRILTEKWKIKISTANKGKHRSEESREKMSKAMMGRKHSEETKRKMCLSTKGKIGSKNPQWKGDKACYVSKHRWITKHFGKARRCEFNPNHVASRYHWANISGKYTRDLNDYASMCPRCHRLFDIERAKRSPATT